MPNLAAKEASLTRYVALLRAVNVAGHARLRMAALTPLFAAAGAREARAFAHAGNVLFSAPRHAVRSLIANAQTAIADVCGERPSIMLRTAAELTTLVAAEPFAHCEAGADDKLYVAFLARKPRRRPRLPATEPAEGLTAFALRGREALLVSRRKPSGFYGFPNAFVEALFGVSATTRNWSTVTKLTKLLEGIT